MKQNLFNKLWLRVGMIVAIMTTALSGTAWAAEEVYKTALFGSSYNSKGVSAYTGVSFDATNAGFTVTAANFNNNNNQWSVIKCGGKNGAYTGTIITKAAIDEAITKVAVTIDAITSGNVTSIKLYTSSNGSSWTEAGTFDKSTGAKVVTLSSPTANLYYKIEFVCTKGSSNGLVTVSKVEYYYLSGGNPSCATPEISGTESFLESTEVSITCGTSGATIYYTTDGSTPTTSSNTYSAPFTLTSTATVKAIAVKSGMDNSAVATKIFTKATVMTVAQAIAATPSSGTSDNVYIRGIVSAFYNTSIVGDGNNYRYYISDDGTTTDQLLVFKGTGLNQATFTNADDLLVGDEVIIYGKLTTYQNAAEVAAGNYLYSWNRPAVAVQAPTFSPASGTTFEGSMTVTLTQADGKSIYYTTNGDEPTSASTLYSAPFTINATTTVKAIAKDGDQYSTVATATYTLVSLNDISDITTLGDTYNVKGTVVAINGRGLVIGDGTGYVYYYKNEAVSQSIGDKIKISGTTGTYGQILQFTNTATVEVSATSNYTANTPAATVITAVPDYTSGYHLSTYLEFEGELTKSNNSYFITVGSDQVQISYPTTEQGTALTALDGKTVHVKGYFAGINSSSKFTVMLESVEEVVVPSITASNVNITYDATSGSIAYGIENPVTGTSLTAVITDGNWLTLGTITGTEVPFTCSANESNADRTATITLSYTGAADKVVTVTQAHFVEDYATLPFNWAGGASSDLNALTGVTTFGLGSDYTAHSPYLVKFDSDGDYIQVKTNEQPGTVTIGVKMIGGNTASNIIVQESADGNTFTEVETLAISGAQNSTHELETTHAFASTSRYVRLYFNKGANVGVGAISIAQYVAPATYELTWTTDANIDLFVFDENDMNNALTSPADVMSGTTVCISLDLATGYELDVLTVDNGNITLTDAGGGMYSFTMPARDVAISATSKQIGAKDTYTLATAITSGKHYVITNGIEDGDVRVMAGQNTNNRAAVSATITSGTLSMDSGTAYEVVAYGPDANGNYTLYDVKEDGYLYAIASSNYLKKQDTNQLSGKWTITFDANKGNAVITAPYVLKDNTDPRIIRYNTQGMFSCYVSGQEDIYLFEKENDTPATVTASVSFNGSGYATYASTNTLDFLDNEVADYSAWQITSTSGATITFEQVTTTVASGKGLLLKKEGSASEATLNVLPTGGATLSSNKLVGITADTQIQANQYYGLSGTNFVKVNAGTVPAGKALLPASEVPSGVKAFTFVFEDDATGIKTIETVSAEEAAQIFNLAGQRINKMQKGINIVNGKKILR